MMELNGTFLIQLVNFLVMMALLHFFLFKPVMGVVEKRNKAMKELEEDAARSAAEAGRSIAEYDAKMAEMKKTTASMIAVARQQAASEQEKMLKDAHVRYSETFESAMAQMESQVQAAKSGLRGEVEKISRQMASRILGRNV